MTVADSFEDLVVWQRGCRVAVRVFKMVRNMKNYGLKDQIERSAISISSNIAEGSERPPQDFAKFIGYLLGSVAELKTQLYIADEAALIDTKDRTETTRELSEIARMLNRLRQSLDATAPRHRRPR